jgi:hypothetical protein
MVQRKEKKHPRWQQVIRHENLANLSTMTTKQRMVKKTQRRREGNGSPYSTKIHINNSSVQFKIDRATKMATSSGNKTKKLGIADAYEGKKSNGKQLKVNPLERIYRAENLKLNGN